ncbi:MAG: hypothetical protein O8C61_05580 [Candidatus Methanoperedens sp.]|nr:hypothetical protein [Candidatus Methanoperedens sp.]
MAGFPMAGQSQAKIVDPNTVYTDHDKRSKANLTSFQVAVLARGEALQRCLCDPDQDIVINFMDELRQHSRSVMPSRLSLPGIANQIYKEVATTRVAVEDRKRTMNFETNTI